MAMRRSLWAERLAPDVVLMDIRMPDLDGIQATRLILANPAAAGVRIVILTTFDLDEYVYDALKAGAERIPSQGPLTRAACCCRAHGQSGRCSALALRHAPPHQVLHCGPPPGGSASRRS